MSLSFFLDTLYNILGVFINSDLFSFIFPILMSFFIVISALYIIRYLISLKS